MADPLTAAIAWIGAEIGGTVGATLIMNASTIAAVTAFTATIAGTSALQRRARAQARDAYNANLKDREITIRSAVAPRRVIYGRDKVSGPLIYAQSTGDKGQYLHLVVALAAHECDAIEEIWFNDQKLPDPDVDGWITSGQFGTQEARRAMYVGTVSGGGAITLPEPAERVTDITQTYGGVDGPVTFSGIHTPGSATVSGLPPGTPVTVGYDTAVQARKVRIRKHLGQPGQVADADLVAESGGKWTSAHKGKGICYLYVRLEYDQDIFGPVGVPNISAVVRGKKVLDPRTGSTAWSENAALIAADWLRDTTFGLRAEAAEVPGSEVIAAANICDELVTLDAGGATQKRYIFGGSFTADQTPRSVLEDILSSMAGSCVWTQGRWLIRPGAYRTPDAGAEISDDDLAGPVSIQPRASRSELFNAVRATYRDPAQGWAEVQAPLVSNATYEAQDGGVRVVRSIQLPCAMDALRAQRLAKIELERSRQAVTVQFPTNMRGYNLAPTDTALLLLARYGWGAGKVFEVRSRTWSAQGALQYVGRETAAAVYAWNYGEATAVDPAPDTALPSPYARPALPAGLAVASGTAHLLLQADGTIVSRASVSWVASTEPYVQQGGHIEVQWSASGSSDWQVLPPLPGDADQAYIAPLPDGQAIVVRARAVNAVGVRGAWAYQAHVVVGKSALPAVPSGLAGQVTKGLVRWSWAASSEADYARTEIRAANSGWGGGGALWTGAGSDWQEPVTGAGTLVRYARHVDTSGNLSSASASASVTVTLGDLIETIAAAADAAATNASTALGKLSDIASDSLLTPNEKPSVILDHDVIVAEQAGIDAQATNYGVTTEKTAYDTAVSALTTYLATLTSPVAWDNTSGNTTIVRATFLAKFQDVYTSRQSVLNKIAALAKTGIGDAQAAADAAASNASTALSKLSDIASDSLLTPNEKPPVILDRDVIVAEQAGIDAQATNYGVTTEKTTYDTAVSALTTYLATLTSPVAWDNTSGNTTIVRATFLGKFSDVYVAKQAVLDKIAANAKARLGALATLSAVGTTELAAGAATGVVDVAYEAAGVSHSNII